MANPSAEPGFDQHQPRCGLVLIQHRQPLRLQPHGAGQSADVLIQNNNADAPITQEHLDVADQHRVVRRDHFDKHDLDFFAGCWTNGPVRQSGVTAVAGSLTIKQKMETAGETAVGVVVSIDEARDPADSLKPLLRLVAEDMDAINRIILDKAVSDVEMIPELAHHLIDSGGKRLRPMLAIASAKLCGYQGNGHIRTASAIEFMHTATLLHDDVVDESDTRRGRKTARLIWGNQASVLVGDFLLGQAFRMLVDVGSLAVLQILSNAAAVIAEGEVMQLAAAKNTATTEDEYLAIINAKTAALFLAAAEVGGALSGRPAEEQAALQVLRQKSRHRLSARR